MKFKYIDILILGFSFASVLYSGPNRISGAVEAQLVSLSSSGSGKLKLRGFDARELEWRRQFAAAQASADARRMNGPKIVLNVDQQYVLERYKKYQAIISDNRRIRKEFSCQRRTLNCCTLCLVFLGSYLVIFSIPYMVTSLKRVS